MNLRLLLALLLIAWLGAGPALARDAAVTAQPVVAGWIEAVTITDKGLTFDAKLDTGAETSSINGRNVNRLRRGGETVVRFDLSDDKGRAVTIEAPLVREARIRRPGQQTEPRPVVKLAICVAGHRTEAEFTVADRAGFDYQVLVGRNVMAGRIIVDPGRQSLASAQCGAR